MDKTIGSAADAVTVVQESMAMLLGLVARQKLGAEKFAIQRFAFDEFRTPTTLSGARLKPRR